MYTRETRSFPKENPHNSRSPVRAVLDHVDRYEEHPDGFWCVCPAHGDRNPSLHVEESEDGIALLICRAGCEQDRVMAALEARGMRRGELFAGSPSKGPKSPLNGPKKETTSSYQVRDAEGVLRAIHVRLEGNSGKTFRWKGPDGGYGRNGEIKSAGLPLYGSEFVRYWPEGCGVVLVEGEKAADALRGRGIRALGTVTGASSTPGADALAVLEGNKVVLWPDADDQGRKHMLRIAERLQGVAASVRYFEWSEAPEKGDAADHRAVRTGEGMGELKRALGSAPEVGEESSPEGALSANRLVRHRVQLAGILGREPEPPPFQQPGVLVRGALHLFFGAPECGKSWFALWLTVHAINRGERVLYLDSENGKRLVAQRLEALGAREDAVRDYLHYLPHPDLDLTGGAKEDFEQFLDEVEPELVVFDSWVNFLSQSGLSEDSSTEIEAWCQAYAFPARNRGITVAILDHTPHDMDRPRGSSRKTAVVDYSRNVRKRKDFDRETVGEVQLYGGKDREGVMPREVTFAVGPSDKGRPIFRPHSGVVEQPSTADGLKPSERRVLGILRDEFGETGATHSSWLKAFEKDRRAHGEEGSGRATFKRAKNRLLDLGMVAGFTPQTDQCRVQNPVSPTSENQYPRDTEFRVVSGHAGSGPNGRREPYFSAKVSQQSNSGSLGFKSGSRSGEPEKESRVHRVTPPIGGEPVSPTFPAHGEISIEDYPGEDDQIEVLI